MSLSEIPSRNRLILGRQYVVYDFILKHYKFYFLCNSKRWLVNFMNIVFSKAMTKDLALRGWWYESGC